MSTSTVSQSTNNSNYIAASWDQAMGGQLPESPWREAFRQAVAEVAANAKEALPKSSSRIDAAVKIALTGDVKLLPGGKAQVSSQSNGVLRYFVINGECQCQDAKKAPDAGLV